MLLTSHDDIMQSEWGEKQKIKKKTYIEWRKKMEFQEADLLIIFFLTLIFFNIKWKQNSIGRRGMKK